MMFLISLLKTYLLVLIGGAVLVVALFSMLSGQILHSPWFWMFVLIFSIQLGIAIFRAVVTAKTQGR